MLLIASPGFCRSELCWDPVSPLGAAHSSIPSEAKVIYVEIYKDGAAADESPVLAERTAVVDAIGLTYEPVMFSIYRAGKVTSRLDSIFDEAEIALAARSLLYRTSVDSTPLVA